MEKNKKGRRRSASAADEVFDAPINLNSEDGQDGALLWSPSNKLVAVVKLLERGTMKGSVNICLHEPVMSGRSSSRDSRRAAAAKDFEAEKLALEKKIKKLKAKVKSQKVELMEKKETEGEKKPEEKKSKEKAEESDSESESEWALLDDAASEKSVSSKKDSAAGELFQRFKDQSAKSLHKSEAIAGKVCSKLAAKTSKGLSRVSSFATKRRVSRSPPSTPTMWEDSGDVGRRGSARRLYPRLSVSPPPKTPVVLPDQPILVSAAEMKVKAISKKRSTAAEKSPSRSLVRLTKYGSAVGQKTKASRSRSGNRKKIGSRSGTRVGKVTARSRPDTPVRKTYQRSGSKNMAERCGSKTMDPPSGREDRRSSKSDNSEPPEGEAMAYLKWHLEGSKRHFSLGDKKDVFKSKWVRVKGDPDDQPEGRLELSAGRNKGKDLLRYEWVLKGMDPKFQQWCELEVDLNGYIVKRKKNIPDKNGDAYISGDVPLDKVSWGQNGLKIKVNFGYLVDGCKRAVAERKERRWWEEPGSGAKVSKARQRSRSPSSVRGDGSPLGVRSLIHKGRDTGRDYYGHFGNGGDADRMEEHYYQASREQLRHDDLKAVRKADRLRPF